MNQIDSFQEPGSPKPIEEQIASAQAFLAVILAERTGPLTEPQRDMLETVAETIDHLSTGASATKPPSKYRHVPRYTDGSIRPRYCGEES